MAWMCMQTHEKETDTSVPQACYGMDVHTHEKETETSVPLSSTSMLWHGLCVHTPDKETETGTDKRERETKKGNN